MVIRGTRGTVFGVPDMERPLSVCPIPGRGTDGTPTAGAPDGDIPGGVGPRYGPIPGRGTEGT